MWEVFKVFGSLRVMNVLHDLLGLGAPKPPRQLLPLEGADRDRVSAAFAPRLAATEA